jgi:hypothetical protein
MHHILLVAVAATVIGAGAAFAGPIGNACLESPRAGGNAALCRCIQAAADATLTPAEQRRAARFFRDPHAAQETRASTTEADNLFWDRYVAFGRLAEGQCAG